MKLKIIGFKVGKSRPTANRTVTLLFATCIEPFETTKLGRAVGQVVLKSDFISIRRVND